MTWGGLRGSLTLTLGASSEAEHPLLRTKVPVLAHQIHSSREGSAIVETWCLNARNYVFPVTSAVLRRVQTLQGPCSLVGNSLAAPARNGRACGGGERSCRSCKGERKGLKENSTENEKPSKTDVESELYFPGVC